MALVVAVVVFVVVAAWPIHNLYFVLRSRRRPSPNPPPIPPGELPPITCVVPAANEAQTIRAKLENLRQVYPQERSRVIVVLNNSTDDTGRICEEMGVTVIESAPGKLNALEAGRVAADTEYVLVSDCDVRLEPDTVTRLLTDLIHAPSDVCVVSALCRYTFDRPTRLGRALNAHMVRHVRFCHLQGEAASSIMVQGPCHLYRKSGLPPYPVCAAEDDLSTALEIVRAGRRGVTDVEAGCTQPFPTSVRDVLATLTRHVGRQIHTCVTRLGKALTAKPRLFGLFIFPCYVLLPRCVPLVTLAVLLSPFLVGLDPLPVWVGALGVYVLVGVAMPLLAIEVAAIHFGWVYALTRARRGAAWNNTTRPHRPTAAAARALAVREVRAARHLAGHLRHTAAVPFHVIHFVTNRCDLTCRHCFIHGHFERPPSDPWRLGNELSLAQIDALTRSMDRRLGMVSLTGGEPFLRPDLLPIAVAYVENAGATIVQVPTNGLLRDQIEDFTRRFLSQTDARLFVWVSFDGLQQTHDRSRGRTGAFEQACGTVRSLRRLTDARFTVGGAVTVADQPTGELVALFGFLTQDLAVDAVSTIAVRGAPTASGAVSLNLEGYRRLNELARTHAMARAGRSSKRLTQSAIVTAVRIASRRLVERTLVEHRFLAPCTAGRALVVVHADGRVYPCELLNRPMGDLRDWDMDLPALMRSRQARRVRRHVRSQRCFCGFECAWVCNTVFEPRCWGELALAYARQRIGRGRGA